MDWGFNHSDAVIVLLYKPCFCWLIKVNNHTHIWVTSLQRIRNPRQHLFTLKCAVDVSCIWGNTQAVTDYQLASCPCVEIEKGMQKHTVWKARDHLPWHWLLLFISYGWFKNTWGLQPSRDWRRQNCLCLSLLLFFFLNSTDNVLFHPGAFNWWKSNLLERLARSYKLS